MAERRLDVVPGVGCGMPQPTDSARAAGLLFKPYSKVSACGRRVGGLRRNQRLTHPTSKS